MKRIISIFLMMALIFSFVACSNGKNAEETTTTTLPPPVIKESAHSKEFKDENGKVVFTVDVILPQIAENCEEKVKNYINKISLEIFDEACVFAENNIENASKYLEGADDTKHWSKKISFETVYSDSRYLSFIIKDAFSLSGDDVEPEWITKCFDLNTGAECKAADFSLIPDDPAESEEILISDIVAPYLRANFYPVNYMTEEVIDRLPEFFDADNFYLTEEGMGFYFPKSLVYYELDGIYTVEFTWNELSSVYALPEN